MSANAFKARRHRAKDDKSKSPSKTSTGIPAQDKSERDQVIERLKAKR